MKPAKKMKRERRVRPGPVSASEAQAREQFIVSVATKEFLDKGYEGASLTDISSKCRISKTTLYRLFRSKEELFSHIAAASISLHRYNLDHALDAQRSFREIIRHVVELIVDETVVATSANSILKLAISERTRFPSIGRRMLDHFFELARPLGRYLKSVAQEGVLTEHSAQLLAYHLMNMACGGFGPLLVSPAVLYGDRSEWVRFTVNLFATGFPLSEAHDEATRGGSAEWSRWPKSLLAE
jgi:AcrR family transcriptional regulator